jgi:hypothetical protein
MKIEIAEIIVNAAEEIGLDMSLRENYSGRGMFGKTTTGIIYNSEGDLLQAVGCAAANLKQAELEAPNYRDDSDTKTLTVEEFLNAIRRTSRDNMGHSGIIY